MTTDWTVLSTLFVPSTSITDRLAFGSLLQLHLIHELPRPCRLIASAAQTAGRLENIA